MTISRPRTEAPRRRPPSPRLGRVGVRSGRAAFLATGPTAWYDARDLLSTTQQTLTNRVGTSTATLGSTGTSDTNDPVALPYSGTAYVYLPGTASNNLSIVKGAWAGTLHVTATLIDDTTATFTTTADPVLIGNVLLSAGRYKKFVVRDTDGSGTVRVTIEPSVETLGQSSWTCTTGQTVTVNRATSGLTTAVVTRPLLMADGTDDYVQLPAGDTPTFTATTGAFTVAVVGRIHNQPGPATAPRLYSSESGGDNGMYIYRQQSTYQIRTLIGGAGGTAFTSTTPPTVTASGIYMAAGVVNNGTLFTYVNGAVSGSVSTATVGVITHTTPRLGTRGASVSNSSDSEFMAHVVWTRALTVAELDIAYAYLTGTYA